MKKFSLIFMLLSVTLLHSADVAFEGDTPTVVPLEFHDLKDDKSDDQDRRLEIAQESRRSRLLMPAAFILICAGTIGIIWAGMPREQSPSLDQYCVSKDVELTKPWMLEYRDSVCFKESEMGCASLQPSKLIYDQVCQLIDQRCDPQKLCINTYDNVQSCDADIHGVAERFADVVNACSKAHQHHQKNVFSRVLSRWWTRDSSS